jgi:hypothetical protein
MHQCLVENARVLNTSTIIIATSMQLVTVIFSYYVFQIPTEDFLLAEVLLLG